MYITIEHWSFGRSIIQVRISYLELEGVLRVCCIFASQITVGQSNIGIFLETDEKNHHTELAYNTVIKLISIFFIL